MHAPRTITLSDGNWTKKMVFIPGTCDQFVVKEVLIDECYAFNFNKNDVVLDLGGNIGSFCVYAFDRVKNIYTFEPDLECFQRLEYHLSENKIKNVYTYNLAIWPYSWKIKYSKAKELGHNTTSIDWDWIDVDCIDLREMIEFTKCTKIKCDIEGFEYEIFRNVTLPESVNEIWMETHTFSDLQKAEHKLLCDNLTQQWFGVTVNRNDEYDRTFLVCARRGI